MGDEGVSESSGREFVKSGLNISLVIDGSKSSAADIDMFNIKLFDINLSLIVFAMSNGARIPGMTVPGCWFDLKRSVIKSWYFSWLCVTIKNLAMFFVPICSKYFKAFLTSSFPRPWLRTTAIILLLVSSLSKLIASSAVSTVTTFISGDMSLSIASDLASCCAMSPSAYNI